MTEYRQEQPRIDEEAKEPARIWLRCVQGIDKQTKLINDVVLKPAITVDGRIFGSLTAQE
jgi:hypothetical protein